MGENFVSIYETVRGSTCSWFPVHLLSPSTTIWMEMIHHDRRVY